MEGAKPQARTEALLTEEVDGELLVYDENKDVACRLNPTAALVWRSCDGTRTLEDLRVILSDGLGEPVDADMVLIALDELVEHDLIASGYEPRESMEVRLSRRRFFRRAGVTTAVAVAAPVVYSMVVPAAAAAQSGYPYYTLTASDRRLKRNIQTLRARAA